jgi:sugar phosphate isomerase/epimerase
VKLAVSNIIWPTGADAEAADILLEHGVSGVELAPGKAWQNPSTATRDQIHSVRAFWESRGLKIAAFQALVFGQSHLALFGESIARNQFVQYLRKIMALASDVGATSLVFGSPKNRSVGQRPIVDVWPIAINFFQELAELAKNHHVKIGLEAIPRSYGCDFITTVTEAVALVRAVNHPGFGLHLDAGGMAMTGESPSDCAGLPPIHYHVSEPNIVAIDLRTATPHQAYAQGLVTAGYRGWLSIEVREPPKAWQDHLRQSLVATKELYKDYLLLPIEDDRASC